MALSSLFRSEFFRHVGFSYKQDDRDHTVEPAPALEIDHRKVKFQPHRGQASHENSQVKNKRVAERERACGDVALMFLSFEGLVRNSNCSIA